MIVLVGCQDLGTYATLGRGQYVQGLNNASGRSSMLLPTFAALVCAS